MESSALAEVIAHRLTMALTWNCPKLSGNMKAHIFYHKDSPTSYTITISGPSYDLAKYFATHQVVHDGKYDYALSVNEEGAFHGESTKSQHWVNRSLMATMQTIKAQYNAELLGGV